jgi:hypothetical protein
MTVNDCLECSELYNENANLEMRIAAQKQLNKRLRVQRDALLAACEAAKGRLGDELPPIDLGNHICGTPHADCDMDCMRAQDIGRHNRAVRKIDAAIAKAHGDG